MKLKLVSLLLLAGSTMFAGVYVRFGVGYGYGYGPVVAYAPPPAPVAAYVPPAPGLGYTWVGGYYAPVGPRWVWHGGYWARPPYAHARWIAPRYYGHRWYGGYWRR